MRTTKASTSVGTVGRPGYCRCLEPSNFLATSFRYQARMVSGLATQATSRSALRPTRFPISARVARSGSLNRNLDGSFARRIRFSAARYSFCSRSFWFTDPVTYASSFSHFLFLMPTVYLTLATGRFSFLTIVVPGTTSDTQSSGRGGATRARVNWNIYGDWGRRRASTAPMTTWCGGWIASGKRGRRMRSG
jgi:hypothetical protein